MSHAIFIIFWLLTTFDFAIVPHCDAQQVKRIFRIGFLTVASSPAEASWLNAFQQGLKDLGYVEGQDYTIEQRSAAGVYERLPQLADELIRTKVNFILSGGSSATRVAQKATRTIPIIMANSTDHPVTTGFVASLSRPGGNITGLTSIGTELSGKRLELLKETLLKASRVAVLLNPKNPGHASRLKEMEMAAHGLGITLQSLPVRSSDIESAFREAAKKKADALNVMGDGLFNSHRIGIAELAIKNRLPTMYDRDDFVEAGGLMSYGVAVDDLYRRAASYVDKVIKGAKPGELPVEQPTKFELVINLRTAKQIGLTIPPNVLARADRVIR
jgi:putative tryptophan/tyrosine transport system substrate-binding protein